MFSIGGPVVKPGRKLRLVCDMWDFPGWKKVAFYAGARKLGEVKAPAQPSLTITAAKAEAVCSLTALATGAKGVTRASGPFYLFVRDPSIPLATPAETKKPPLYKDKVGLVGTQAKKSAGKPPKESGGPVLIAAGLSASQEKQFGKAKGTVSAFWELVNESIHLTPKENGAEGTRWSIVNTADARMCVKAAHTARGLYLYVEVNDDHFMECNPARYYSTDAVDIMIDSKPSAHIADTANDLELLLQTWGLSLTTRQIHVAFGNKELPPFFLRNFADPWDFTQHRATFEEGRKYYGIDIRIHKLSKLVRAQEWFLPWAEVGVDGLPEEPTVGTRLAFTVGYNDMDPGQVAEKKLRWLGGKSPWQYRAGDEPPRGWGDIEIGPPLKG
jgi:hypothetical protein